MPTCCGGNRSMMNRSHLIVAAILTLITACHMDQDATTTAPLRSTANNAGRSTMGERSELAMAVMEGDPVQVKELLTRGADPNDTVDGIPLISIVAAERRCSETLISALLEHGANPNSVSPLTGTTPIMEVAGWANEKCFMRLLKAGADLHASDTTGRNLVAHAAEGGDTDILQILVDAEVLLDQKAVQNVTPLMIAAYAGHKEFMKLLIKSGEVDLCARDIRGRSARVMGEKAGHRDVQELLPRCEN